MNPGRYGFTNHAWLQLDELPDDMAQKVKDIAQVLPAWVEQKQVAPHGYDEFEKPFYKASYEGGEFNLELEFHLRFSRMSPKRAIIRDIVVHK
ncbi:MAG: hypothetical protein V3S64_17035 [bacterium]